MLYCLGVDVAFREANNIRTFFFNDINGYVHEVLKL